MTMALVLELDIDEGKLKRIFIFCNVPTSLSSQVTWDFFDVV